jgi:hypothetical protein
MHDVVYSDEIWNSNIPDRQMNIRLHHSIVEVHMCGVVSSEDIWVTNIPTIKR